MNGEFSADAFAERIERLELKIAFLERANHELSDVMYRQQQEIKALESRLGALASRLAARELEQRVYTAEEERPPHY